MTALPILVIATRNRGKLDEFAALLSGVLVELRDLSAFPQAPQQVDEPHDSYLANAMAKARSAAQATGLPALADDSGLEVDALGGKPGVRSARYAGDQARDHDNLRLLLSELQAVPDEQRRARFRCVIVVALPDGEILTGEGCCEGLIARQACGKGGFGYDPVFYFPAAGRTFAEMSASEKNRISHRARACEQLRPRLLAALARGAHLPTMKSG